jgi:hypothetical protein
VQSSADLASNLPNLRGIWGPPACSMARALANWMRSAQETSGQESLMGERSLRAMSRALLAPYPNSGLNRMEAVAPPFFGHGSVLSLE